MSIDINNTLYASSLDLDKICGVYTGSYDLTTYNNILGGYLYQKSFSHGLTQPAFAYGLFSTDQINWVPSGVNLSGSILPALVYTDSTNFNILIGSNAGLLYYKIILQWIKDYNSLNVLTSASINTTNVVPYFSTKYNYQKIQNIVPITISAPAASSSGTYLYNHNLGVYINYKVFFNSLPGQVWQATAGGTGDFWLYNFASQIEVSSISDANNIQIKWFSGSSPPSSFNVWIIVYYDHASI